MKILRGSALALLLLLLAGCFDTATLIKVKKDGSGTIEERLILSDSFTEMLKSFSGESETAEPPESQPVDEQKLLQKAQRMGEGVELVSAEPLKTDVGSGYKAVYRFKDINKVRVSQNPGENISTPAIQEQQAESPEQTPEEYLQFRFTKGQTAILEILSPPAAASESPTSAEEETQQEDEEGMMQMMRQLYQDMKIRIAIEVEGKIVETNAAYREGSTVTMVDLDFARLMQDEAMFRRLITAQPKTLEDMKGLVAGNPALKIELQERLTVRFR